MNAAPSTQLPALHLTLRNTRLRHGIKTNHKLRVLHHFVAARAINLKLNEREQTNSHIKQKSNVKS